MTLSRCFPIRFVRCPPSKFFIASINSPSRSFGGEGSLHSLVKIPQLFLISSVMQHYNCVAGESFWYLRLFNIHPKIRSNLTHRRKRLSRCHVQIVDPCSFPVLQRLSGQPRTGECCSRFESSWSIRRFLVGRSFSIFTRQYSNWLHSSTLYRLWRRLLDCCRPCTFLTNLINFLR